MKIFGLDLNNLLSNDEPTKEIWRSVFPFIAILLFGLISIVFFALQYISNPAVSASIFGSTTIIAGASLLSGGLLGFLFGIPRTLPQDRKIEQDNQQEKDNQQQNDIQANTNLEEISDWLTKILVGVGLTQIHQILKAVHDLAKELAFSFSNPVQEITEELRKEIINRNSSFTLAILVYFSVCGFFLGFLWARLYLPRKFSTATAYDLRTVHEEIYGLKDHTDKDTNAHQLTN